MSDGLKRGLREARVNRTMPVDVFIAREDRAPRSRTRNAGVDTFSPAYRRAMQRTAGEDTFATPDGYCTTG